MNKWGRKRETEGNTWRSSFPGVLKVDGSDLKAPANRQHPKATFLRYSVYFLAGIPRP